MSALRDETNDIEILVLDGETRTALAVVRSLGAKEIPLAVASSRPLALAANSRFCKRAVRLPDPRNARPGAEPGELYMRALLKVVADLKPRMLLPLSDLSCSLVLEWRDQLPAEIIIPGADRPTFERASNKASLLHRANQLGLLIPQSVSLSSHSLDAPEVVTALREFPFPGVLKPETSEQRAGRTFKKAAVTYVDDVEQVRSQLLRNENKGLKFLLQQRIFGNGVGVFAICLQGNPLAIFCHRRLLEKPPSGGRSVLSESIPESAAPVDDSLRLLKALKWDGVAMVEFKQSSEGEFFLMEINPRFWGSLQLAIDCGRDFPFLLYQLFRQPGQNERSFEELRQSIKPYAVGRRLRWGLGCLDHALILLKQAPRQALSTLLFRNGLCLFSAPRRTTHETLRLSDPRPFFCEVCSYLRDIFRSRTST